MALKKGFLTVTPPILDLSPKKISIGIALGLCYAFAFYAFLDGIREVFRLFTINEYQDLMLLTPEQRQFYNRFYAFLSVIFGQSGCFTFWLDRPKSFFDKRNHRKTTIVNDQRVLNWYFLHWFAKLTIVIITFYSAFYENGSNTLSFYPDYKYVFVLILVVLYLQTWTTIRFTFKEKSGKWLFASAILLSLVAYGLSFVSIIDHKAINESVLSKNIFHTYDLHLPESAYTENQNNRSMVEQIYVANFCENSPRKRSMIIIDNEKIEFHDLESRIIETLSERKEYERHRIVYELFIERSTKMTFVTKLNQTLAEAGVYRISYAVSPETTTSQKYHFQGHTFPFHLPMWKGALFDPQRMLNLFSSIPNCIKIQQTESGQLIIRNTPVEASQLSTVLKQLIQAEPDHFIQYFINADTEFLDYIKVLAATRIAVDELRQDYSLATFSKTYDNLDSHQQLEVRIKYPFRIVELTREMLNTSLLNNGAKGTLKSANFYYI